MCPLYRQQGQEFFFPPQFPPSPGGQDVFNRLDRLERQVQRLNNRVDRLDRRVDRLERRLGFRDPYEEYQEF
nr:hypothetical protein [Oikeobacillus pervagus]